MRVITVTGHRPSRLENSYELMHPVNIKMGRVMRKFILEQAGYDEETKMFREETPIRLVTGMALGADTVWAMVVIKLKQEFPGVFQLECAIPCANHDYKFNKIDRDRYHHILRHADEKTQVSDEEYKAYLMQKRNEHMVNISDTVFAIWDGVEKGGTYNCIKYAIKKERTIFKYFPLEDETWSPWNYE